MAVDPVSLVGQAAVYKVVGSQVGLNVVSRIMLLVLGTEPVGEQTGCWLQLEITKADGQQRVATVLVDDPLLSRERAGRTRVLRYIYQEGADRPIEYVNAVRGGAVTTEFGLLEHFFPTFEESDLAGEPFPATGRYLGLRIERMETTSVEHSSARIPGSPLRLELDPELLIGTGRNVRDTQGGRIWTDEDYSYRRLEAADYDELIAAGMNYFIVDEAQELLVQDRPVFYLVQRRPRHLRYPEMFYRANCRGTTMFMDEPGVHIVWFITEWEDHIRRLAHPSLIARLLEVRIGETYNSDYHYGRHRLEHLLRMAPFDLGQMHLSEAFPSWETTHWSVYYQLKAGLPGAVHEGRYVFGHEPQIWNAEFGVRIPCRPESALLWPYAFFRGAARVFEGEWGTAIYGQCEEALAPLAMQMAYDMGARQVWFWTSDHGHHVPHEEQVALTRGLRAHAAKHPRPALETLRAAAAVAIAVPDGYAFGPYRLWNSRAFHLDRRNASGVTFREVLSKAAEQVERCIKEDVPFDIVYSDDAFTEHMGEYEQVIFVHEDGRVEGRQRVGETFEVPAPPRSVQERQARPPELAIRAEPSHGPVPLKVKLSAEVKSHSGPVGVKVREENGPGWDHFEMHWNIHHGPTQVDLERRRAGQDCEVTFDTPGTYRIEGWTCDDQGVAARKWLTVRAE